MEAAMSNTTNKKSFLQNYALLIAMVVAIIAGCVIGAIFPKVTENGEVVKAGATVLAPLGKVFINLMFCIVVPMVFASIAGAVANMGSRKRAGKIMGTTVITFVVTGAVAALIMFLLMKVFPPVLEAWNNVPAEEIGDYATLSQMIVNFFTAEDFVGLLTRRAMLPLIVFSLLFGFAVNLNGGKESMVGKFLDDLSGVMMKLVKIIHTTLPSHSSDSLLIW
jgi:Na+/H+-dicarboxylate symporter